MYSPYSPQPPHRHPLLGGEFMLPLSNGRDFNLVPGIPTQIIEGYHAGAPHHSIPEHIPWQTSQVNQEPSSVPASAQVSQMPALRNFGMWTPSGLQSIEPMQPRSMEERDTNYVTPASRSPCNHSHNIVNNRQSLPSPVSGRNSSPHPFLHRLGSSLPYAMNSRRDAPLPVQPFPPTALYQSLDQTPLHFSTRVPQTEFLRTRSRLRVSQSNFARLSRFRRTVRVIEHDGLRLDEEELIKGLMEPDGKIIVHKCRWKEDLSPCNLWIRGDESCINAHIRRWHGGKSGSDSHRLDCRWSACGAMMRKDSIARHIATVHLGEMWECQGCGKAINRSDVYKQHVVGSKLAACRLSGALITYPGDAREVDVRTALQVV